jgi:hypothetical protein
MGTLALIWSMLWELRSHCSSTGTSALICSIVMGIILLFTPLYAALFWTEWQTRSHRMTNDHSKSSFFTYPEDKWTRKLMFIWYDLFPFLMLSDTVQK